MPKLWSLIRKLTKSLPHFSDPFSVRPGSPAGVTWELGWLSGKRAGFVFGFYRARKILADIHLAFKEPGIGLRAHQGSANLGRAL